MARSADAGARMEEAGVREVDNLNGDIREGRGLSQAVRQARTRRTRSAQEDPRGFLGKYSGGAVTDQPQRRSKPLPATGCRRPKPLGGQSVPDGSQHFVPVQCTTQSLTGQVGFVKLIRSWTPELLVVAG